MGKYNTHCHSNYSDGSFSIEQLAIKHKELGYDSLVITDHLYNKNIFLTKESFIKQWEEIQEISKKLEYPIIQGIELNLFAEEILLFNREIILNVFDLVDNHINNLTTSAGILTGLLVILQYLNENKESCGIILCHPSLQLGNSSLKNYYAKLFSILDGYEEYNHGRNMFKNREIPEELKTKKAFRNSDAHGLLFIETGDNYSEYTIDSEQKLIAEIKQLKHE